jgi:hypothetical protein
MSILNTLASDSKLAKLIGDPESNHIGYVYSMNFREALVLTNDSWKEKVAGIPHNSFLLASGFDPKRLNEASELDREVILLRVLGPASLPSDADLLQTRIEHNQRRTSSEIFNQDVHDGLDPITQNELQYGGVTCRILGTFYMEKGDFRLGSDIENYMSSTRLRVFKPRGDSLSMIVNHINPEVEKKSFEEARKSGFSNIPSPIEIGTVRYTSSARLHRGPNEELVPVHIQPTDFLSRRTAILGMTRTGKSNTVKTTISSVAMAAKKDGIKVGQIIFDINGEYANANHQDDGSSIAEVFGDDCIRYRAIETSGFKDLRTNFFVDCASALNLLAKLTANDPYKSQTDLGQFLESSLEEPDQSEFSERSRWAVRRAAFQCILSEAGFPPPQNFKVDFPISQSILQEIDSFSELKPSEVINRGKTKFASMSLDEASEWFQVARQRHYALKREQNENNERVVGLTSSKGGKPWVDATLESFLNVLARKNAQGNDVRGYRAIVPYKAYHSAKRQSDVVDEILVSLKQGRILIIDLSVGPVEVRTVLSKRIAQRIFDSAFIEMNQGKVPQNMVVYVEEAHNLIGRKDELTDTWPRIAKEGAKAKIAFVYATQEPSSIHPNILANTENWFVTHLNNEDELRALAKFYDFADFSASLKTAQDVGFARIKTLSSPFVIPTQINRFTPEELKNELDSLKAQYSKD